MIIHGRNLIIKAGGVAIAAAKSCDINVQCEEIETASPSTGEWRTAITGRKSWSISTNQLVTGIVRPIQMVGTSVSLDMGIEGSLGLPFAGFVDNVEVSEEGAYDSIVWDKTRKKFLFKYTSHYTGEVHYHLTTSGPYDMSGYTSPSDGSMFHTPDNTVYTYYNENLHVEKLTGNANVVTWRVTGTVGNLAQGSFQFNGNGALTPASLPATT